MTRPSQETGAEGADWPRAFCRGCYSCAQLYFGVTRTGPHDAVILGKGAARRRWCGAGGPTALRPLRRGQSHPLGVHPEEAKVKGRLSLGHTAGAVRQRRHLLLCACSFQETQSHVCNGTYGFMGLVHLCAHRTTLVTQRRLQKLRGSSRGSHAAICRGHGAPRSQTAQRAAHPSPELPLLG